MHEQDLALNNQQELKCYKTQQTIPSSCRMGKM